MRASSGAWPDDRQELEDGDGWAPSDQEISENLSEMRSLLQTVGGSIGRLEALGAVLRSCATMSPESAPPGALSLAAAVEEFGQQPSRPSQMNASADYAWQSQEQPEKPGASYVVPDTRGAAFDGMIFDALQQLYPLAAATQSNRRGAGVDPRGDPALMGQMRLPAMEEHDGGAQFRQQFGGQAMHQPHDVRSHFQRPDQPLPQAMYAPTLVSHESTHHVQELQPMDRQFAGTSSMELNADPFLGSDLAEGVPSLGSIGHHQDMCKPCVFLYNGVCLKAARCQFCHMPHNPDRVRRVRPSKRTRNLLRQHRDDDEQPGVQPFLEPGDPRMCGLFTGVQ